MNVALIGYGKMGREIEKILLGRGHEVVMVIDESNISELNADNLRTSKADVAIEFTTPDSAYSNIVACLEAGIGVVSGTTGWLDRLGEVREKCAELSGTFFYASNYSIGVNIFFKINELLSSIMGSFPQYDVTVEETHHNQKKDAPSGTAITIAEAILRNLDRKKRWTGETTILPDELEVTSVRRSVVPGIHTVTFESETDLLRITHEAKSRKGLAEGVVMAAEFILGRKGIYSMDDILGL